MAKNYWPHAIVGSLILIVASCVATVVLAVKNPVEMDGFYFERYQNVDENINEIEASQRRFDAKYDLDFNPEFVGLNGYFGIAVTPKNGLVSLNFTHEILLTRPATNEQNQNLDAKFDGQILKTQPVTLPKKGRWQILLKISDANDTGFYKFNFEAR